MDGIYMQFLAAGESLKRSDRMAPGLLVNHYPHVDGNGAMGFRDLIAHQNVELDVEHVLVICDQSLPSLILAVEDLLES